MAQEMLKDTGIRLFFETGLDGNGEPIIKSKSFNNVRKEATVEQIYQASQAIASLSSYPLISLERNNSLDVIA
ncbi:DUF1659 domain-containing protein [Bacillus sp. T3]|uniref:DUF1659 domain-containing protein n=1 Tax=Bacillus sp. T3 TaxID=467262 RepID=UPI00298175BB|nr:DUF1659 domain-containing protein [Bacillus sp. T3]